MRRAVVRESEGWSRSREPLRVMAQPREERHAPSEQDVTATAPPLTLVHPLEGLEQLTASHPNDFHYAFLDDSGERETRRIDAVTLRRQTAEARDALAQLAREHRHRREQDRRASSREICRGVTDHTDKNPLLNHHRKEETPPPMCVLLVFPPGLDFLPVLLGAMAAGVVAMPAYPPDPAASTAKLRAELLSLHRIAAVGGVQLAITTRTYAAAARIAEARVAIRNVVAGFCEGFGSRCDARFAPRAYDMAGGGTRSGTARLQWMSTSELIRRGRHVNESTVIVRALSPEDREHGVAFVQYTSGSTSAPKGVRVGHRRRPSAPWASPREPVCALGVPSRTRLHPSRACLAPNGGHIRASSC